MSLPSLINIHLQLSPQIFEEKKVQTILMGYSGARGTSIHEKKLKSKISCQTPFKCLTTAPTLVSLFEGTPRRRLKVTSSLNEISAERLGHSLTGSNGNDIETKRNDTSIIGVFSVSKRNEPSYSRICWIEEKTNIISLRPCSIEAKRPDLIKIYVGSNKNVLG